MSKKFKLPYKLTESFEENIKISFVKDDEIYVVTKDDQFYEIKSKEISKCISTLKIESKIVGELCYKKVVDLANGSYHYIARTSGLVYSWGKNISSSLGDGTK
jgi:alpha-tubulin suppressor-like RCC1 family protein